jgi:hypothetical protein
VALGAAVLARGNFLALLPFGAAALWLEKGDPPIVPSSRHERRARATLFLTGTLAVVAIATARNWIVARQFVPTTSNLGMNLYIGHYPGTIGTYFPPPFVRPDPDYEEVDFASEAARRSGRPLDASETSAFWAREALEEIVAAPGEEVVRTVWKLWLFWNDYEQPDNDHMDFAALEYAPVLRLPVVRMGLLFPLALLGAVVWWRRNRGVPSSRSRSRCIAAASSRSSCSRDCAPRSFRCSPCSPPVASPGSWRRPGRAIRAG